MSKTSPLNTWKALREPVFKTCMNCANFINKIQDCKRHDCYGTWQPEVYDRHEKWEWDQKTK